MVKRFSQSGFSLIELLMVVALVGIVSVIGLPLLGNISGAIELGEAARQVERELQSARMTAVSANHPVRVMFNCPVAGQYRMVELIGTPGVPAAADGVVGSMLGRSRTRFLHPTTIRLPGRTTTVRCAGSPRSDVYDIDDHRVLARRIGAHEHRGHQPVAAHCSGRNEHHPDAKR